jgi:hypothetical protein
VCWLLVHGFHGSTSDPLGRRTSSSFFPRPQRRLQCYGGKKPGRRGSGPILRSDLGSGR